MTVPLNAVVKNWASQLCDMAKHELQVTSCELRATSYELKALKHELKFKSASSDPRVTSLTLQVMSSNLRVTIIISSIKTQVNSLEIFFIY